MNSNKLLLTSDDPFAFNLPVLAALRGVKSPLYNAENHLPHPEVLIGASWNQLQSLINNFLDTYEAYDQVAQRIPVSVRDGKGSKVKPSRTDVIEAYRAVIYSADELIEKLHKHLKACLLTDTRIHEWKSSPKRWRDYPTIICNKLKHNHNLMVTVEADYKFGTVRGYGVCRYENNAIMPNWDIHPKRKPFPFGADLRRILVHIFLISHSAYLEMHRLCDVTDVSEPLSLKYEHFLKRVSAFMPLAFHHYRDGKDVAIFDFNGKDLQVADSGGTIIPTGDGKIGTIFSGDGRTRTFYFF